MRKRIALLTSQVEEKYIKDFTEGFMRKSFSYDYDVCVFSCFDKEPDTTLKEVSEANIFNLINWQEFDAFVVTPDVLSATGLMTSIEEKLLIHAGRKPVLFVDQKSDYFPYVVMNQNDSLDGLVDHMIDGHGYNDIIYISGPMTHIYSQQRLHSFKESMKRHNIEVQDDHIYYGNYWFNGGIDAVEDIFKSGKQLPDAFMCANDFMALGVCEALIKRGVEVPGQVAVTGFDSAIEGRDCDIPITSVNIPFDEYGEYVGDYIHNMIEGKETEEYNFYWEIFEGESCGCLPQIKLEEKNKKYNWNSYKNYHSVHSRFSGFTESIMLQDSFRSVVSAMRDYSFQIREFDSFVLCLNDVWSNEVIDIDEVEIKHGYTERICPVLICTSDEIGSDTINYGIKFDRKEMLPLLYEECDYPRGFIFSPVYFDDVTFGYAVISYGKEAKCYDGEYSSWMHTIMLGIENYRRTAKLIRAKEQAEEIQDNDIATGMFNYNGFIKHARPMIGYASQRGYYHTVLAIEIDGIDEINSKYGRKDGENLIHDFAFLVYGSTDEGALCCRLDSDVFVVAEVTPENSDMKALVVLERLQEKIADYNKTSEHKIKIYSGIATRGAETLVHIEDLVSEAVNQKNGNKAKEIKMRNLNLNDDEIAKLEIVKKILDENLFDYHFQPIVSAKDGSIYAYEALMRPRVEPFISPLDVLKCAEHLDRLYDVEKATFLNVLSRASEESDKFDQRKIFVNSIPGTKLSLDDSMAILEELKKLGGKVVVELTEQAEASDDELNDMKRNFLGMGVETAVDDYGTGYSNIVNLLRYMPNYVKIDRMLLSNIQNNPQKVHFVKDIVAFAKENKFKVLAEGVETKEELETVIRLGVDLIQGYYTSRPKADIIDNIEEEIQTQIIQFNRAV